MKRFAFLLLLVLLIFASTTSATCSNSKRDVLGKRTNKKCPCAIAAANFPRSEKISGFTSFAQDECGQVTTFGAFCDGFDPKQNYTFDIIDNCGNVIVSLGNLGITSDTINADGSTQPFSQRFDTFNLNCDKSGIFYTPSAYYKKRNCHPKNYKRQADAPTNTAMQGSDSSGPVGTAPIYPAGG